MNTQIRKMRKRIKDKKWLLQKLDSLMNELSDWNTFEKFECSSFFRGYKVAEYNREKLCKGVAKTERQITFIQNLLNRKP